MLSWNDVTVWRHSDVSSGDSEVRMDLPSKEEEESEGSTVIK